MSKKSKSSQRKNVKVVPVENLINPNQDKQAVTRSIFTWGEDDIAFMVEKVYGDFSSCTTKETDILLASYKNEKSMDAGVLIYKYYAVKKVVKKWFSSLSKKDVKKLKKIQISADKDFWDGGTYNIHTLWREQAKEVLSTIVQKKRNRKYSKLISGNDIDLTFHYSLLDMIDSEIRAI